MNNEKHIGIINLQFTANYGAVIAAAVLEDAVRGIVGSEYAVNTINYFPCKEMPNRFQRYKDQAKQYGGWRLYLKAKFPKNKNPQAAEKRRQRFIAYKDSFLNLTPSYNSAYDINKDINYSAFITGSDVVWAPKRTDDFRSEGYYLKFADKGEKRIAYAPSLDCSDNRKLKKISQCYKDCLSYIDCISVREKSNIDFIQSLTEKKVYECCDPAFLVEPEYYDKMIDTAQINGNSEKYIYVYILEVNDEIVKYANKLAKEKNLKICYYSPNHSNYTVSAEDCTADGPAEFLYRLRNAEYVLTNSFHCVVFSLLFEKKFLSFTRSKISIKSSDLLRKFGLESRVVSKASDADIDKHIDFDKVSDMINKMRDESMDFLKDSLRSVTEKKI